MYKAKTPIIPAKQEFVGIQDDLDLKAICCFVACGFFLGEDTYWKGMRVLPAASYVQVTNDEIKESSRYFEWRYEPAEISLSDATDEFAEILEGYLNESVKGKDVILPLSGGLDSRTLAAALRNIGAKTAAFSYSFTGGHDETVYAERIANACQFDFSRFQVDTGYLWNCIDDLAQINECYSDFTHPRQMAFINEIVELGDIFALGHWGDVLFDDMGIDDNADTDTQLKLLKKKVVKPAGYELAESLWENWGLPGSFNSFLDQKLRSLLEDIPIENSANARIRAFKSLYWAPRWTSVNLGVFSSSKAQVSIPYYAEKMCDFVCRTPESLLADRKIQIEYLKKYSPDLAKITWQSERPFNLYNYNLNRTPWNLPYRIIDKARRMAKGDQLIERNWELQFLGESNSRKLYRNLFDESGILDLIPRWVIKDVLNKFETVDSIKYSHSVSMLLTISKFFRMHSAVKQKVNVVTG